jgi:hypothetical protein
LHSDLRSEVAKRYANAVTKCKEAQKINKEKGKSFKAIFPKRKEPKDYRSLANKKLGVGGKVNLSNNSVFLNKESFPINFSFETDQYQANQLSSSKIKYLRIKRVKFGFVVIFSCEGTFSIDLTKTHFQQNAGKKKLWSELTEKVKQNKLRRKAIKQRKCAAHNESDKYTKRRSSFDAGPGAKIQEFSPGTVSAAELQKAFSSVDPGLAVTDRVDAVGIDFGCGYHNTLTLSNGDVYSLPARIYQLSIQKDRMKALLKAKPNQVSKGAQRLKKKIDNIETRIVNIRSNFGNEVSKDLLSRFSHVFVEDIGSADIVENNNLKFINKQVHNAAFGQIKFYLQYKAEIAGISNRTVLFLDTPYTSQLCPACLGHAKKLLSQRKHRCKCGVSLDRDLTSSILFKKRGLSILSLSGALDKAFEQRFKETQAVLASLSRKNVLQKR